MIVSGRGAGGWREWQQAAGGQGGSSIGGQQHGSKAPTGVKSEGWLNSIVHLPCSTGGGRWAQQDEGASLTRGNWRRGGGGAACTPDPSPIRVALLLLPTDLAVLVEGLDRALCALRAEIGNKVPKQHHIDWLLACLFLNGSAAGAWKLRMRAYTLVGTPVESRTWAGSFHEADSKVEGS